MRLVILCLLLAGCSAAPRSTAREACQALVFEGSHFTVCHAALGTHAIALVDRWPNGKPMREFAPLSRQARTIAFAMNAGMFDASGLPIGLYVERGRTQTPLNRTTGPGNFHLLPNGVFYGDAAGWHVVTSDTYAATNPVALFATQSGPMLVIGGTLNPQFSANGTSLYRRNGVGIAKEGDAWFAISDDPVSFGRFARLFRDRLGCGDALYFDGYVSRLWDPVAGRMDGGEKIGPIVVVRQTR